eukprot:jgi/Tetstr1/429896/TSEL_019761.t1
MVNSKRREVPAQNRRETKRHAKSAVAAAEEPSLFSKVAPALANTSPAPSSDSGGSDTSAGSAGDGMEDAVDFAIANMSAAAKRRASAMQALRADMWANEPHAQGIGTGSEHFIADYFEEATFRDSFRWHSADDEHALAAALGVPERIELPNSRHRITARRACMADARRSAAADMLAMAKSTASSIPSPALPAEVSISPESDDGAGEVLASAGATLENREGSSAAATADLAWRFVSRRRGRQPRAEGAEGRATYQFAMEDGADVDLPLEFSNIQSRTYVKRIVSKHQTALNKRMVLLKEGSGGSYVKYRCAGAVSNKDGKQVIATGSHVCPAYINFKKSRSVPIENQENYEWFLDKCTEAGLAVWLEGTERKMVVISDRDKGLAPAVANRLPSVHHHHCTRHIIGNMKDRKDIPSKFGPQECMVWDL